MALCESSAPGIFAAGDVANWLYQPATSAPALRIRLEHWDNALRQGETVARNLLGEGDAYRHIPYFWSDQYDLKLQYVGYTPMWDEIVMRGAPPESFVAFYLLEGHVRAAFSSNRQRDLVTLKKLVAADPLSPRAVSRRSAAAERAAQVGVIPAPRLRLAGPFAPTITVTVKDFVGGMDVLVIVERRIGAIRCRVPGAWIEDLEDP